MQSTQFDLKQIMHRTLCNSKGWLQRERSSYEPAVHCFILAQFSCAVFEIKEEKKKELKPCILEKILRMFLDQSCILNKIIDCATSKNHWRNNMVWTEKEDHGIKY